jgi:aconitate hydratase
VAPPVGSLRTRDLAAVRDAQAGLGGDPQAVNPVIPAGLVADHSVVADVFGHPDARDRNVEVDGDRVYPDVCLGTDSHTTMVNGLGVLGWGIGGIEAEAVMLEQSLSLVVPPVVGFRLTSALGGRRPGTTRWRGGRGRRG